MTEKKEFNGEKLHSELHDLLNKLAQGVKSKEEVDGVDTKLWKKIALLSGKIDSITTKQEMERFLDDVNTELAVLKEYKDFQQELAKLEKSIDEIRAKYIEPEKKEFDELASQVKNQHPQVKKLDPKQIASMTPEQLKKLADTGREKASEEVLGVVANLAQRNDWIGKLARKAMG